MTATPKHLDQAIQDLISNAPDDVRNQPVAIGGMAYVKPLKDLTFDDFSLQFTWMWQLRGTNVVEMEQLRSDMRNDFRQRFGADADRALKKLVIDVSQTMGLEIPEDWVIIGWFKDLDDTWKARVTADLRNFLFTNPEWAP